MLLYQVPTVISSLFPDLLFHGQRDKKTIYLTFDDGPHPEITNWTLDLLKEYEAKATFFCVGENVVRYAKTFNRIVKENHATGNHTFNHLNGWKTKKTVYLSNTKKAQEQFDF